MQETLDFAQTLIFLGGGAFAGFIDSIAGGGGLITLPLLSVVLGPGVHPIATNKIVGMTGALTALIVYSRARGLDWRLGIGFCATIILGSFIGSLLSPHAPKEFIRWFLIAACPILLTVIWKKDRWLAPAMNPDLERPSFSAWHGPTLLSGLACGLYDGAFGPGGGTFMFLSLAIFVRLPIFSALAISKLANTLSAGISLASYATAGYVHWRIGAVMAIGMLFGSLVGSNLNLKHADRILRPILAIAVLLLLSRLLYDSFAATS
jgi:uncharacterized membrane protein YfcA